MIERTRKAREAKAKREAEAAEGMRARAEAEASERATIEAAVRFEGEGTTPQKRKTEECRRSGSGPG